MKFYEETYSNIRDFMEFPKELLEEYLKEVPTKWGIRGNSMAIIRSENNGIYMAYPSHFHHNISKNFIRTWNIK